jgi:phosphatidylserine/phosphatidylglycerophosphate/cardiolipin synthase-like enzyme
MKKISLLFYFFFALITVHAQLITISTARTYAVGAQVTVSGVCMNGQELGNIRYIDDGTGSIAVFSAQVNGMASGDVIEVTGVLSDYFGLLEIINLSSFQFFGSGNPLPSPLVTTPASLDENTESHLVRIDGCTFINGGGVFAGNANYAFTANGETGQVRIGGSTNLAGQPIPSAAVSIVAICSQYQTTYQLLPRDVNDIFLSSAFYITSAPVQQNITSTGFDVNWSTNLTGSTFVKYGITTSLELGILSGNAGINHQVTLSGLTPSQVYYVQAFSVNGNDTVSAAIKILITASTSSGTMRVYFNKQVNNNVAWTPANLATQLNGTFKDTIAACIDRAQQSLDLAIYNFDSNNTTPIIQAINNAYARGVVVRIIYDGGNANNAISLLNSAIPKLASPTSPPGYYSIMHNKFLVMDANAGNADWPVVITGSTNFTNSQLTSDANNLIIIQDKSLARSYTMEFDEMWGGSGALPNTTLSKFGPDKTDNTPHEFLIGGNRVEAYFSPSDNVNNQILNTINTADQSMYFANLVYTRFDLAYAMENRINQGVIAYGMIDDSGSGGGFAFNILQAVMGSKLMLYNHSIQTGILHHKYLIVDQGNPLSDPLVLTGSHNWSSTANLKNDENTLIVHNRDIANQYYQEFVKRFTDNGGILFMAENENDFSYSIYPNPASAILYVTTTLSGSQHLTFKLTDVSGNIVLEQNLSNGKTASVSTNGIANGVYFFQFQNEHSIKTGRVVICK